MTRYHMRLTIDGEHFADDWRDYHTTPSDLLLRIWVEEHADYAAHGNLALHCAPVTARVFDSEQKLIATLQSTLYIR